jgi:hypothetical protein
VNNQGPIQLGFRGSPSPPKDAPPVRIGKPKTPITIRLSAKIHERLASSAQLVGATLVRGSVDAALVAWHSYYLSHVNIGVPSKKKRKRRQDAFVEIERESECSDSSSIARRV